MAMTKEIIISNALTQMGHAPIQTLDNSDELTVAAEQAYDLLTPAILENNNWRFAIQIAQLSQSTETPPAGSCWNSVWFLPAGYLKNIRIYPQNYDYDIYENFKIYSNWNGASGAGSSGIWMEYVFMPDPSRFPNSFCVYLTYAISAYLALSNAQKPEFAQVLAAERDKAFAMCAAIIAQNRPNFSQVAFPVLNRRNVTGIIING